MSRVGAGRRGLQVKQTERMDWPRDGTCGIHSFFSEEAIQMMSACNQLDLT